eukprot:SAG31_NODE_42550_length_271_cov_0.598837_1_plen_55_part_10
MDAYDAFARKMQQAEALLDAADDGLGGPALEERGANTMAVSFGDGPLGIGLRYNE